MVSRVGRTLALVLAALLLSASLGTATPGASAPELKLRYALSLAGVPLAKLTLGHEIEGQHYRTGLDIDTIGLAGKLLGYHSESDAAGRVQKKRGLVPRSYNLASETRKKTRTVRVRFDPASGDVIDLRITKRGKPGGTDVPPELQKGVIDPLSAFLRLREHAAALRDGADLPAFEAAVFDGRRRTDMSAHLLGRDSAVVAGRTWPVLRLALSLTPLAGYDDDDLEAAGDLGTFDLELLLSDDERLLPLRLTTLDWLLTASIELVEDCSSSSGCRLAALER